MHPLSTFNSNTFQARLRLSNWWIGVILLILMAELVLRLPFVNSRLPSPEYTLWHATLIQAKLDYLKAFETNRGIDVLFVGNSTVQSGIDPQVFDQIRDHAGNLGGSFNGAIEGLPPYGVELFFEIYTRYSRPKVIIYGVTPQDLNSNSPWAQDVTRRVKESTMAVAESRRGPSGLINRYLLEHSYLFRYRFLLHQMLITGKVTPPPTDIYFNSRGFHPIEHRLSDVPKDQRDGYINRAGVLNYSTEGEQLDSLIGLVEYCREHDIQLILVNMPLAKDYFANFDSPLDYETYLTTLDAVSDKYNVPLWEMENPTGNGGFTDSDFADFNHLNHVGAKKLSTLLAEKYNSWVSSNTALNKE